MLRVRRRAAVGTPSPPRLLRALGTSPCGGGGSDGAEGAALCPGALGGSSPITVAFTHTAQALLRDLAMNFELGLFPESGERL